MFRSAHLKDAQLLDCYLAGRDGDAVNPRHADHLTACGSCRTQFEAIAALLDDVRGDADAEIDTVFPAERLEAQQHQIARRIEHVHRSARVITFPSREALPASRTGATLTARWVAASAAAGLFIGVAVGSYLGPERIGAHAPMSVSRTVASSPAAQPQRQAPAPVLVNTSKPAPVDDDAFLMDLELALARPQPRELQAFDALTPHVRDLR